MANYPYFDLTGGTDVISSDLNINQSQKRTSWYESKNVEFWGSGGIAKMRGNRTAIQLPNSSKVLGVFEYLTDGEHVFVFVFSDGTQGHFCTGDVVNNTYTIMQSGLDPDAKCNFCNYLNGVVVSNGVDDLFIYTKNTLPHLRQLGVKYQRGTVGRAICSYKGRLFMGSGDTVYYSADGDPTEWLKSSDAGFVSGAHGSSAPIIALENYSDKIAVHRENQVLLLAGDGPSNFAMAPFGDKGSKSPYGIVGLGNKQLYYDDGIFALEFSTMKDSIQLSDEFSVRIHDAFKDLNSSMISDIVAVPYPRNQQLWFYMATGSNTTLDTCWIMDITSLKHVAWYRRVATPVTCACKFNSEIYTGTADGRILLENVTNSLDGQPFEAYWWSPWFTFGDIRLKSIEELQVAFDGDRSNSVYLQLRYDTVKSKVKSRLVNTIASTGKWDTSKWDSGAKFKDFRSSVKRMTIPNIFRAVQIGFRTTIDFAINGFEFFDVTIED